MKIRAPKLPIDKNKNHLTRRNGLFIDFVSKIMVGDGLTSAYLHQASSFYKSMADKGLVENRHGWPQPYQAAPVKAVYSLFRIRKKKSTNHSHQYP